MARELRPDLFGGTRGHFLAERIEQAVISRGVDAKQAREAAESIATFLGSKNEKYKDGHKTDVALYFSPSEIDALAEVVAQQLRGEFRVKNEKIKPLFQKAVGLINHFDSFKVIKIDREENKEADKLANKAVNLSGLNKQIG